MLTENSYTDRVEVLSPSLIVQVRVSNEVLRDGEVIAQSFSRYVLEPGADLTNQPESVVKICSAIWG
jgi:hypothetical protein